MECHLVPCAWVKIWMKKISANSKPYCKATANDGPESDHSTKMFLSSQADISVLDTVGNISEGLSILSALLSGGSGALEMGVLRHFWSNAWDTRWTMPRLNLNVG